MIYLAQILMKEMDYLIKIIKNYNKNIHSNTKYIFYILIIN